MNLPRTYWHLQALGRKPTDYEIATSRLLHHPQKGFETNVPVASWYERYQQGSPLRSKDWERFEDPRATTCTTYCSLQNEAETFVDGVLRVIEDSGYDRHLAPEWRALLEVLLPTLRYPVHGLQMAAAYLGQMSPAGRITICALMQTADEIRRIQRLAYRMRQLQQVHPGFGSDSRERWEQDPAWQPLRRLIERLLVTYDWGEALVALQFAIKPVFDALCMERFATLARRCGDNGLESILYSLGEDCRWHRQWSAALLRMACSESDANRNQASAWFEAWLTPALAAAAALLPLLAPPSLAADSSAGEWLAQIEASCRERFAVATQPL